MTFTITPEFIRFFWHEFLFFMKTHDRLTSGCAVWRKGMSEWQKSMTYRWGDSMTNPLRRKRLNFFLRF